MVLEGKYISAVNARKKVTDLVSQDSKEDPYDFFRLIIKEMSYKMSTSDDDTVLERYCN
jgi:hypothetical protein